MVRYAQKVTFLLAFKRGFCCSFSGDIDTVVGVHDNPFQFVWNRLPARP